MNLTELQRLAEAATPGPWYVDQDARPGMEWNRAIATDPDGNRWICAMMHSDGKHPARDEATASYISSLSPDVVLWLIAIARAAAYVAKSNGFDAAYPDKMDALRQSLEGVEL